MNHNDLFTRICNLGLSIKENLYSTELHDEALREELTDKHDMLEQAAQVFIDKNLVSTKQEDTPVMQLTPNQCIIRYDNLREDLLKAAESDATLNDAATFLI